MFVLMGCMFVCSCVGVFVSVLKCCVFFLHACACACAFVCVLACVMLCVCVRVYVLVHVCV